MLMEPTLGKLYDMKLNGMAQAFREQLNHPTVNDLSFDERFSLLVDQQWTWQEERKMKRLLQNARLKLNACIEDIDFKAPRGIDKSVILSLANCEWIRNAQNIIITGFTGAGKSWIASALGHQGCQNGYKVLYRNCIRMFDELKIAKADGSYIKEITKIAKMDLLILDDFGLKPLDNNQRLMLLEIFEDRHGIKSTIIISQLPVSQWHDAIGDATIADSILDRIVHGSHRIELKGEVSMRKIYKNN